MSLSQSQRNFKRISRNLSRERKKVGITEPWSPNENKAFKCPNCNKLYFVPGTTKYYYCKCITRVRPETDDKSVYYGNEDQITEEFTDYLKIDVDKHVIRKNKYGVY